MFPFRSLPPSFRFAASFPCVTSVLSFHVLCSVRYFFPFVSTLRVVSTLRFRSLRLSFRFTFSLLCVTSVRSFQVLYPVRFFPFRFNSSLPFAPAFLLIFLCRLNCSFPFAASFLSFQVSSSICYFLSFVLTLMSCSFRFSFRFNSSFLFVASVPSYQLFCLARLALPFLSPCPFRCVHPFVLTLPSYLLFRFHFVLTLRFSTLTSRLTENLKKCRSREKHFFFKFSRVGPFGLVFAVQAATCGHLRPLAPAATCDHLRPFAATCGHLAASGCKWLQIMQMAASDAALEISNPTNRATGTCGHVRPRAATCGHVRPRAATCGHVRPLAATCGHLRPLAATRVAASGCKWLLF